MGVSVSLCARPLSWGSLCVRSLSQLVLLVLEMDTCHWGCDV